MCRDWVTQAGCNRGQAHPPGQGRLGAGKDCSFWLAGDCRYAPGYCNRGAHVEGKKGSKPYRQAGFRAAPHHIPGSGRGSYPDWPFPLCPSHTEGDASPTQEGLPSDSSGLPLAFMRNPLRFSSDSDFKIKIEKGQGNQCQTLNVWRNSQACPKKGLRNS